MKREKNARCPCCSGKTYAHCCQKYHEGVLAENALALMRSRYSAYALGIAPYIIATTHPDSPYKVQDKQKWLRDLAVYSSEISFEGLEILETALGEFESYVTFFAKLRKGAVDLSFTERSRFLKEGQSWLYVDGKISRGRS